MITTITCHHVFQSVWALIRAHFTTKVCFFSDVAKAGYLAFLTEMIFFTSSIVSYHIKVLIVKCYSELARATQRDGIDLCIL